ncbi:hypothetical protein ACFX15_019892 [Malus domestica]
MSLREKIEAEASFKISKKYPFIFAAHSGGNDAMRKPRILLAATGSVVVLKFVNLCQIFSRWVAVKAVATRVSLCFIDQASLPNDVSDLYQAVLDIWPEIESIFSFKPTSAVRSLAVNSNLMRGNNINSINKS